MCFSTNGRTLSASCFLGSNPLITVYYTILPLLALRRTCSPRLLVTKAATLGFCQSCRHSQRTSSADVTHFTHFTLFTITFEPETFFFLFVCSCDSPNSGLSQRLTPRVLQDRLKLRCTCLSSGLSPAPPRPRFGPLHPYTHH